MAMRGDQPGRDGIDDAAPLYGVQRCASSPLNMDNGFTQPMLGERVPDGCANIIPDILCLSKGLTNEEPVLDRAAHLIDRQRARAAQLKNAKNIFDNLERSWRSRWMGKVTAIYQSLGPSSGPSSSSAVFSFVHWQYDLRHAA